MWALQAVPATTGGRLRGVSCTSASACTAIGYHGTSALADRWNGSTWKTQSVPKPTGAKSIQLNGVNCTSGSACTAVGSGIYPASPYNAEETLAERWNGTAWKIQSTPNPGTGIPGALLSAISCTSASACTTVGSDQENLGDALAEQWNGTSWQIQSTPNPNAFNELLGVSCPTSTCMAVGDDSGDSGSSPTLTLAMQGT